MGRQKATKQEVLDALHAERKELKRRIAELCRRQGPERVKLPDLRSELRRLDLLIDRTTRGRLDPADEIDPHDTIASRLSKPPRAQKGPVGGVTKILRGGLPGSGKRS